MNLLNTVKLSTLFAFPFVLAASAQALTFDFGNTSAYGSDLTAALARAGNNWSSRITDDITVRIDFSFISTLPSGVIGGASPSFAPVAYSTYRAALVADAKSALDVKAVASLEADSAPGGVANYRTTGNGQLNAPRPSSVFLFNLNQISVNTANLRAVGLLTDADYTGPDALMRLSSSETFDFNPDDGIEDNAVDFVGTVTHELGHALGFMSGVDALDSIYDSRDLTGNDLNASATSLDLFRYQVYGNGTFRSLTIGDDNKYFSFDGGATLGAQFSTGSLYGDLEQASHWKDDLGLGIMDPTVNMDGTLNPISMNDLMAFDAIGYDLNPVPEPATFVALGGALVVLARRRRR